LPYFTTPACSADRLTGLLVGQTRIWGQ